MSTEQCLMVSFPDILCLGFPAYLEIITGSRSRQRGPARLCPPPHPPAHIGCLVRDATLISVWDSQEYSWMRPSAKMLCGRVPARCALLPHSGGGEILAVLFEFCSVCYCNSPEGMHWPSSHHHMATLALSSRVLTSQQETLSECSSDKGDNSRKSIRYVRASTCF